jgi:hypothetical protein
VRHVELTFFFENRHQVLQRAVSLSRRTDDLLHSVSDNVREDIVPCFSSLSRCLA